MATLSEWVEGARPRTLPTAIAAVAVGSGLAANIGAFIPLRALLALIVAVALQVGVNYANDYSDGVKGTDARRVGPVRLVGQELASPSAVKAAAFASFGVAAVAGLALIAASGRWWLIAVGVASVAAAWLYTGGPRPYGYLGLGEIFVFIFFGWVPVLGTLYVQALAVTAAAWWAASAVGLLACAVLVTNNLRDIPTDVIAGKHTLAVRLGDANTRRLYISMVVVAAACTVVVATLVSLWLLVVLATFAFAAAPIGRIRAGATGRDLVPVLKSTGLLVLWFGLTLGLGLALV